jgi:pyruvate dehydrogenase (quinone)
VAQNTAQFMLGRLADWGVKRIYGYPGDGINGLLGAFHEVGDRVEFTQMAHEEIAAFAATAHAKVTGEVGVCMATSGPPRFCLRLGKLRGQIGMRSPKTLYL